MAACRDGENTTFPFLATVRSLVAIVVSVLAVAVVVMVIVFVNRPVELDFQSYGYVQTQEAWWNDDETTGDTKPAKEVQMLILLDALNPSGRGQIQVSITMVRILDIPNGSSWGNSAVEICWYKPETNVSFDLLPHSSHRYRRWVNQSSETELDYLYNRHRQNGSFPVMLVVETIYKPAHSQTSINKTYYCWPVTFLRSYPDGGEVACKATEDMEIPPPAPLLLPRIGNGKSPVGT